MAIGCGATFAKIILIIYNILFALTGLALIAIGIWLLVSGELVNVVNLTYSGQNSELFRNAAILLIAMGALVVIISIIGFVGACLEHEILLGVYIAFLIVIFIGEVVGAILAIVFKDEIINGLNMKLEEALNETLNARDNSTSYYRMNGARCETSDLGYLWDWVQITFDCCGLMNFEGHGYTGVDFKKMCPSLINSQFPVSCFPFKDEATDFGDFHTDPDNQTAAQQLVNFAAGRHQYGCTNEIQYNIEKYAPVLIGIGIGFGMVELFGIIFAVCLCRNVEED